MIEQFVVYLRFFDSYFGNQIIILNKNKYDGRYLGFELGFWGEGKFIEVSLVFCIFFSFKSIFLYLV